MTLDQPSCVRKAARTALIEVLLAELLAEEDRGLGGQLVLSTCQWCDEMTSCGQSASRLC
jgi:hypothetical protein